MSIFAIHFARLGPYHIARISSAANALSQLNWKVVGLETSSTDDTYAWKEETAVQKWQRKTVFPGESLDSLESSRVRHRVITALDEIMPDAVAIAGWGTPDARACLDWCRANGAKAILMSETREADGNRVWWKEYFKRRLLNFFDDALVGGLSHRDYLIKLGFPIEKIHMGYNVVDNAFFEAEAVRFRSEDAGLKVSRYFLASNRFIERKNLKGLIEAYARYSLDFVSNAKMQESNPWNLCLLGDGELKAELVAQCQGLNAQVAECAPWESRVNGQRSKPTIFFPGFRQIEQLPRFYAHAGCFVHPALEEPWGLVINEAMASALPILSSFNVGAVQELVDEGANGFLFDPKDIDGMASCLTKIGELEKYLSKFGEASRCILEERYPTMAFGSGLKEIIQEG